MNETLVELARIQQGMNYGLIFIAFLDFLGVVVAAWALYLTRGTKASVERVAQMAERQSHYLFSKLGPVEMK